MQHVFVKLFLISVQLPSSGPGHYSRDDKPAYSPVQASHPNFTPKGLRVTIVVSGGHADEARRPRPRSFINPARPRRGPKKKQATNTMPPHLVIVSVLCAAPLCCFCFFVIDNSRYLCWWFACMLICALLCLSVSSCLCSFESLLLRGVICLFRCVFVSLFSSLCLCLLNCLLVLSFACLCVCLFVCLYVCFFVPIATLLNLLCCHSTQQAPCTSSELTTPHSTQLPQNILHLLRN